MVEKMQYIINGRKYTFVNIGTEAGVRRGFCVRNKKWAWLYSNDYIQFDGGKMVRAHRI